MAKRIAVMGDYTTTGGRIITGQQRVNCNGSAIALIGDKANCPKCTSMGTIIEGANNWKVEGKSVAYDGCIIMCKCSPVGSHRIIATKSHMFVDINNSYSVASISLSSATPPHSSLNSVNDNKQLKNASSFSQNAMVATQQNTLSDDKKLIRADAHRLLQCADELCEKHLYHDDIKHAFKQDIKNLANNIVYQVDNGSITYEQGAEQLKAEEDSLWEQSFEWLSRGLSILGGTGLMMAGAAMCTTGVGCIVGAYLGAHGINSIQEGIVGGDGYLKSFYQESAKQLGMSESVGSLVYDSVDLGISVKGKLKLVPKLNEFDSPIFKLWHFGRQDLVGAYTQMRNKLLYAEIASDILTLSSVIDDTQNIFILDKKKQETSIIISAPESITNVGEIIDDCSLVIRITGNIDAEQARYYLCTKLNGEKYRKYYDGRVENGGILP